MCGPEGVPFSSVLNKVCGSGEVVPLNDNQSIYWNYWNEGEWLIPEIQTNKTGIKYSNTDSDEIDYINAMLLWRPTVPCGGNGQASGSL